MSSYRKNNYGDLFTAISKIYKPKLIVETGVLNGYSLLAFAVGSPESKVIGIDLFEDYEYNHGNMEQIYSKLKNIHNVELRHGNAFEEYKNFPDNSIDILHIDISNDGEKLYDMFEIWESKIKNQTGLIIFEGGSDERDHVGWMVKYAREPIRLFKEEISKEKWEIVTLTPHPSLTICRKLK